MKKLCALAFCASLLLVGGCKKKEATTEVAPALTPEQKKGMVSDIFIAVNKRDYETAHRLILKYLDLYPGDSEVVSFKLMLADIAYEQGKYAEAYEAYCHFQEYYPADPHSEYVAYKAAHAKFNQANHVTCDSTPVEKTLELCKAYLARRDYVRYRTQMEDLERTCQRNLLDKELYVVNSYLNQRRYASARHRLTFISQKFDLEENGKDHYLLCMAKLAKAENNTEELSRVVDDLHAEYPQSQCTAMADRLAGRKGLLFG